MTALRRGRRSFWRGLQVERSVIFALFMKEYMAKLNGSRFGLFWTFVEPLAFVLILSSFWYSLGRREISGVPVHLFIGSGMLALKFFQAGINAIALGIRQNLRLLDYPNVKPIDAILARFALEAVMAVLAGVLLFGGLYWVAGYVIKVSDYPLFFITLLLALVTVLGLSLLSGVYRAKFESVHRAVPLAAAPLIFVSAVFYPLSLLPFRLQYWLSWNPLVQVNELMRGALFGLAQQRDVSLAYLLQFAAAVLFLGLVAYYANRVSLQTR